MKKRVLIGAALAVILVGGGIFAIWYKTKVPTMLPLSTKDTISSWTFPGVGAGDAAQSEKAKKEIERLQNLFDKEQFSDYELYISIANQYELLGDGKKTYEYLNKAAAVAPSSGLAWYNMAQLMTRLGAYHTAQMAFEKAIHSEFNAIFYHTAYIEFLKKYLPADTAALEAAERTLREILGETSE